MSEPSDSLREQFGDIDVYLFDQLLRGRIVSGMKVLDAGCGSGRNLMFLMRAGFDVCGVDESEEAIAAVQQPQPHVQDRRTRRSSRHGVEVVACLEDMTGLASDFRVG